MATDSLLTIPMRPERPRRARTARKVFNLRIPEHLKAQLEQSASAHGHSVNAEIVSRLSHSFEASALTEQLRLAERERAAVQERCNRVQDTLLELLQKRRG